MGYYLLDNPNTNGRWFYPSRNACQHGKTQPHLIVVHTAENLPDWTPPDEGAERIARYASTTGRKVSWHTTVDSDTIIPMLPDSYTAWHVRGYNRCSIGIEIATQAAKWVGSPWEWREAILKNTAKVVADRCRAYNIPAIRIPRVIADAGGAGIIAHADLDPERRTDPGASFPWDWFISQVKGGSPLPAPVGTPILGPATAAPATAAAYHLAKYGERSRYTPEVVEDIVAAYWSEAPKWGVDPAIAFAQALKETGGFAFGNLVQSHQWNFAGIGATGRGMPGLSFPTIRAGVRAHVSRLYQYAAGTDASYDLDVMVRPLPRAYWGSAPTVEELGGKWAVPGVGYGESIRDDYWKPLTAHQSPPNGLSDPPGADTPDPGSGLSESELAAVRSMLAWWLAR